MFKIIVGRDKDTLSLPEAVIEADTLQEAIEGAMPVQEVMREVAIINSRLARYPGRFSKRTQGKFTYFEYVGMIGKGAERRYIKKRLSMQTESKQLYVPIDAPWVMYDKDAETSYVQFDFISDELRELGWTDEAKTGWHAAEDNKNTWTPVAAS